MTKCQKLYIFGPLLKEINSRFLESKDRIRPGLKVSRYWVDSIPNPTVSLSLCKVDKSFCVRPHTSACTDKGSDLGLRETDDATDVYDDGSDDDPRAAMGGPEHFCIRALREKSSS